MLSPFLILMGLLCFGGLLLQFVAWQRLLRECRALNSLRVEGYAKRADELLDWAKGAIGVNSLTFEHIYLAQRSMESQMIPSAAELVTATEEIEAGHRWYILPNVLLAVSLVIGLAGTMYILQGALRNNSMNGIMKAATALSDHPSDADFRSFAQTVSIAVNDTYAKFGGAFDASLTGILCTVVLTVSNLILLRPAQHRFVRLLHRVTLEILLPKFAPRDERGAERLATAGQTLSDLAATMTQSLRQTGEDLHARLLEMCDSIQASAGRFAEQVVSVDDTAGALQNLSAAFGQTMDKLGSVFHAGGPFQGMADQMARESQQLTASTERLMDVVGEVGSAFQEPLTALRTDVSGILRAVSPVPAVLQTVVSKVEETRTVLEGTRAGGDRREKILVGESERSIALCTFLGEWSSALARVQATLDRWEIWMGIIQSMTGRTSAAAEETQGTLAAAVSSLATVQRAIGGADAPTVTGALGDLRVEAKDLAGLIGGLREVIEKQNTLWSTQEEQKLAWIAEIARRLPVEPGPAATPTNLALPASSDTPVAGSPDLVPR